MSCPLQATTYKLDFEQERRDREELIGRFEGEREVFQADIAKLNDQLTAVHLEHDDTLAQLRGLRELSLPQKHEVKFRPKQHMQPVCVCVCVCVCVSTHCFLFLHELINVSAQ